MKAKVWRLIPFALFLGLALFLWRGLSLDPQKLESARVGQSMPQFSLPDLDSPEKYLSPSRMKKKLYLVNVWASWCPACTQEQVFLLQLANEGIPILGLNYKDSQKDAKQWLHEWGNPYQIVAQDIDGKVAIDMGVYGAPETFLIHKGVIVYRHAGILDEQIWQKEFLPRMKKGQG